jgi:hypothetical protein
MARHETIFDWGIEVLDFLVFIAGVATAAVAAAGFWSNGRVAILILGGLPTVFCLAVALRLCSAAFLKRRLSPRVHVEGDEEGGMLQAGVAVHEPPAASTPQQHSASCCHHHFQRLLQRRP